MEKFDVVVIGGGPGGYPAAIRAAQLGARVALIEKEALGGTCLNCGCIPSKALISASDLYAHMQHAESMGLRAASVGFDYGAMARRKDQIVTTLRGGVTQLLKANKVTVLQGVGSFLGRNRVAATQGGEQTAIEARQTIIATGSESTVPGFLPKDPRVIESRGFLALTAMPASMIVLGGGVIGCEFACMAAQLGVKVTIVELLEDILTLLDADVRRTLRQHMEKTLGIRILTGLRLEDVAAHKDGVSGRAGSEQVQGDLLLVSIGRRPVTRDLGLAQAGLKASEAGFIETDDYCRTRAASIYAIGDVTGKSALAHAATSQGLTAAENALAERPARAETIVPGCIFTSPEIGSVGITEQQAKESGKAVKTGKFMFGALGKAMALGETTGFVKWIADANTDQLLGAHAIGAHATDLIAEAAAALRAELTARELGRTIHCHPTLSEAWMEAAHAVHGECVHQAPPRR